MTGYAQAQTGENGWSLRVSVRSVNHRFLDLHLRVPEGFEPLEPRIRQIVRERVRRGHLDVTLRYDLAGPAAVGVNQEVAAAYLQAVNELRKQFGIHAEPDLAGILRLPGVIGAAGAVGRRGTRQARSRPGAMPRRSPRQTGPHARRGRRSPAAGHVRPPRRHLRAWPRKSSRWPRPRGPPLRGASKRD